MLKVIFTAILVFAFYAVIQLVAFSLRAFQARVRVMTILILLCSPLLYLVYRELELPADSVFERFAFVVYTGGIFTLLWFGYLQFYFACERSPSLRFLIEILEAGPEGLTPEKMSARYSFDDVFRRRVEQMAEVKLLLTDSGGGELRYRNSPKGQLIGKYCTRAKELLNLGRGG